MKRNLNLSSKNAILMGGILLGAYLLLLLSVTNIGQNRLHNSQINELDLKVINYASSLSYLFKTVKEDIESVAKHKTAYTYFANLSSGMSMKYGLGSSLIQLKRNLQSHTRQNSTLEQTPLFDRMLLLGYNSGVITDTATNQQFSVNSVPFAQMRLDKQMFSVYQENNELRIRIMQNVYHNQELVGILVGYVNKHIFAEFIGHHEHSSNKSQLALITQEKPLVIFNSLTTDELQRAKSNNELIYFHTAIEQTPFFIDAWFEPLSAHQLITSNWFGVALSFLAVPVIFGLYFAIRISNTNLVLKTKIEETDKQQNALTQQNELLKIEIRKRKESEQELAHQASHDPLTGLFNRKCGDAGLRHTLLQAKRKQKNVLLMFIDLDNFKQINDTLGHHAGDNILKQTATRLTNAVRATDMVARIGGDEFLLVIPELSCEIEAKQLASKLLNIFEKPFYVHNTEFFVSTSIGMAIYPRDGDNAETLLANADTAMYRVKEQGRNGFSFYDESMNQGVQRNLDIDARLRQAVANEQLEVYYQPILDVLNNRIVGAEALMRWQDEKLGFVPPDEFIPIAERNGLIHKMGGLVLNKACAQTAKWQQLQPMSIAVNFSCVQFRQHDQLLSSIREALSTSGLDARSLDVEITESLLFSHNQETLTLLNELKSMGAQLSIDDFGTGYSALSYLQKFPFDKLKIDRSFLQSIQSCSASQELVNAIIAMAKALGLKVVAEGVETKWDRDYLLKHQCEYAQGYYFSRPLPADEFEKLLKNKST